MNKIKFKNENGITKLKLNGKNIKGVNNVEIIPIFEDDKVSKILAKILAKIIIEVDEVKYKP